MLSSQDWQLIEANDKHFSYVNHDGWLQNLTIDFEHEPQIILNYNCRQPQDEIKLNKLTTLFSNLNFNFANYRVEGCLFLYPSDPAQLKHVLELIEEDQPLVNILDQQGRLTSNLAEFIQFGFRMDGKREISPHKRMRDEDNSNQAEAIDNQYLKGRKKLKPLTSYAALLNTMMDTSFTPNNSPEQSRRNTSHNNNWSSSPLTKNSAVNPPPTSPSTPAHAKIAPNVIDFMELEKSLAALNLGSPTRPASAEKLHVSSAQAIEQLALLPDVPDDEPSDSYSYDPDDSDTDTNSILTEDLVDFFAEDSDAEVSAEENSESDEEKDALLKVIDSEPLKKYLTNELESSPQYRRH